MIREAPAGDPRAAPQDERLIRIVQWLLGLVVGLSVLYFLLYSWRMILFPGQLDYGEGPILQLALRVARGQSLYPPLNQGYPYAIASYLPFYYLLSAAAARITGPSFVGGRLLSALAALSIATCVGLIVHHRSKHRYAALVSGATVVAIPVFVVWATLMRIDMVALACSVAGFCLFQRGKRPAGVVLFALAVFTRWTSIAAIVAALAGLLLARRWRAAMGWGVAQVALIAALVIGAHLVTRGGMHEQLRWHTSTSLGASWTWAQLLDLLHKGWSNWPIYYLVSAVGTAWCLARRPHRALAMWSLGAWAVYLTSGRVGSTYNYFLEPFAVGMACGGVLLGEALPARRDVRGPQPSAGPRSQMRALGLVVMGALALQMVWTLTRLNQTLQVIRPLASGQASQAAVELLREAPGMVMCEDVGLIELAGKQVPFDPFELVMLSRAGAIDAGPIVADVEAGRFFVFITRFDASQIATVAGDPRFGYIFDRFPVPLVRALADRYELAYPPETTRPYYVYVPEGTR